MMMETMNLKTVMSYYNAASSLQVGQVKAEAMQWLEYNFIEYEKKNDISSLLKEISPKLMTSLVSSQNLIVSTEFSLYSFLRKW